MSNYKQMAEANGLGWNVIKTPMYTKVDGVERETPYYAIQRDDNGDVFQSVTGRYEIFQNSELFELADSVASATLLPVAKAGVIAGGRLVYVQLLQNTLSGIGANNDSVRQYITCLNSHDGTKSVSWGITNFTISCQNTFNRAHKEASNKVKHTLTSISRLRDDVSKVMALQGENRRLEDMIFELEAQQVDNDYIDKFLENITGIRIRDGREALTDIHGRAINRAERILESVESEMAQKGRTKWGLWSGVTHYTTHVAGRESTRGISKMSGTSQVLDERALELLQTM